MRLGGTALSPQDVVFITMGVSSTENTALMMDGNGIMTSRNLGSNAFNSTSYLPLTGGTVTGNIQTTDTTGSSGVLRIRSTITGTPSYGYPNVGAGDVVIEGGGTTQRQPGVITLINDDSSISANQNLGVIQFVGKDDATNGYASSQIIGMSNTGAGTGNSGGGILRFLTSNGSTLSERMRIRNDGRVGIGVTSPQATLDVSGNFRLQSGGSTYLSISSSSGSPYINTGTSGGTVQFGAPASNTTNIQVQGTVKATGGYKSSDGSAGITGTFTFVDKASATRSLTIKNGLITAKT